MRFSIGYQLPDRDDSIYEIIRDYRENVSSVYFSMAGHASARSAIQIDAKEDMLEELRAINDLGVPATLLYNANCYGGGAVSPEFRDEILRTVGTLSDRIDLREITTTSPFVARVVKQNFSDIRVCASVNMWIGTPQAMEYLGTDFDALYLQREYNRDFARIRRMKAWCDAHGKQMKLLANSGCMYACAFHSFHDNMVAHEAEIVQAGNAFSEFPSPCWEYMQNHKSLDAATTFLRGSWIRPEDVAQYEPYVSEMKLATRMHSNPRRVVMAYARGRFRGNMFDLTEPSYSRRFMAHILDAERFPEDWFARTTSCQRNCESCTYCRDAARSMLVDKFDLENMYCSQISD